METIQRLRTSLTLALVASVSSILVGCQSEPVATPISPEKSIDVIKNNKDMPENMKQQAIARLQASQKQAQYLPKK